MQFSYWKGPRSHRPTSLRGGVALRAPRARQRQGRSSLPSGSLLAVYVGGGGGGGGPGDCDDGGFPSLGGPGGGGAGCFGGGGGGFSGDSGGLAGAGGGTNAGGAGGGSGTNWCRARQRAVDGSAGGSSFSGAGSAQIRGAAVPAAASRAAAEAAAVSAGAAAPPASPAPPGMVHPAAARGGDYGANAGGTSRIAPVGGVGAELAGRLSTIPCPHAAGAPALMEASRQQRGALVILSYFDPSGTCSL